MADRGKLKKKTKGTKEVDEDVSVQDNAFFKHMLDLIPTHFYFDNAAKQQLHAKRSRADDEDEAAAEDVARSKAEWKRAKFDPKAHTSVTALQQQLVSHEHAHSHGAKKKKNKTNPKSPSTETKLATFTAEVTSEPRDLKQQFQAKLKLLKDLRTGLSNKKEESMEKKRLKRKISRLKQKQKQKHQKLQLSNGDSSKLLLKEAKLKASPAKPLYNKDGNIVFSKFDFTDQGESKKKSEASTGKNYKQLLEKAQKRKEKAKALKEKDKDAAMLLEEKNQWQKVLQKAEGVKVKDDVELLKKSVKRKEKLKKRSKTKWDGRVERVEQKKKEKQEKRKTNIKKKKDGRINKKISKSKKKGHIIPGF